MIVLAVEDANAPHCLFTGRENALPIAYRLFGLQINSSITERRWISECVWRSKSNISTTCSPARWFINKDTTPVEGSRYKLIPCGLNPVRLKFFSGNSIGGSSGLLKLNVKIFPFRSSYSLLNVNVIWRRISCLKRKHWVKFKLN